MIQAVRRGTCRQAFLCTTVIWVLHNLFWVICRYVFACRLLLIPSRTLNQTSNVNHGRCLTTVPHVSVCQHAPGSCILCKQTMAGFRFNSTAAGGSSKDQQKTSPPDSTGKKESDNAGTEGGMLVRKQLCAFLATPGSLHCSSFNCVCCTSPWRLLNWPKRVGKVCPPSSCYI